MGQLVDVRFVIECDGAEMTRAAPGSSRQMRIAKEKAASILEAAEAMARGSFRTVLS